MHRCVARISSPNKLAKRTEQRTDFDECSAATIQWRPQPSEPIQIFDAVFVGHRFMWRFWLYAFYDLNNETQNVVMWKFHKLDSKSKWLSNRNGWSCFLVGRRPKRSGQVDIVYYLCVAVTMSIWWFLRCSRSRCSWSSPLICSRCSVIYFISGGSSETCCGIESKTTKLCLVIKFTHICYALATNDQRKKLRNKNNFRFYVYRLASSSWRQNRPTTPSTSHRTWTFCEPKIDSLPKVIWKRCGIILCVGQLLAVAFATCAKNEHRKCTAIYSFIIRQQNGQAKHNLYTHTACAQSQRRTVIFSINLSIAHSWRLMKPIAIISSVFEFPKWKMATNSYHFHLCNGRQQHVSVRIINLCHAFAYSLFVWGH